MSASGDPLYNTTNTTNTTSTGSTGSPVSAGGMLESVRLMVVDVLAFATQLVSDPLAAATEHKDLVILLLLMIATPLLFRLISSTAASAQAGADLRLAGTVEEDAEELEEEACKAPTIEAVWEIGVSNRAVSVAEEGVVRLIAFTKDLRPPTANHIVATLIKAIARPEAIDPLPVHRPNISVFLPSRICSDAVVAKVAAIMKAKCGMRILTNEALAPELDGIKEKRRQELLRMKVQEEVKVPRGINKIPTLSFCQCQIDSALLARRKSPPSPVSAALARPLFTVLQTVLYVYSFYTSLFSLSLYVPLTPLFLNS
ncbi:hypothetical protein BASA60_003869 [Batrachochytrium salamandrivorans]|nr:hypothetical protein BASA60_003869 [Batrachochytrium salamandrivorans]